LVESLYSKLYHPTQIAKQRFVERFEGDVLDERWTETSEGGAPSTAMSDLVDQGWEIFLNDVEGLHIDFNNIRQYDPTGCVFICSTRRTAGSTSDEVSCGFANDSLDVSTDDRFHMVNLATASFYTLLTERTASTSTNTSVAPDTSFHLIKGEINSTNARLWMDGVLEATHTTNLPNVKMQPFFRGIRTGATYFARIRYYEGYNT